MAILLSLQKVIRREEKEQTVNTEAHDSMTNNIVIQERKNATKLLKKEKFPGPDNITNATTAW